MSFFAYMLRCADGRYYVGQTDDLEQRIAGHQSGQIPGFTEGRRPVTLIWSAPFATRLEALEAERQIKGWSRAKKEALAAGDWAAVQRLARKLFPDGGQVLRYAASTGSAATQDERSDGMQEMPPPPFVLSSDRRPERSEGQERVSKDQRSLPPAIILVRPQLGENIGKAARAMLNFGLTDLRLVTPRDGWPNPDAGPAAAGADVVLERAQVFGSLAEAAHDCGMLYATTVRKRGVVKPVVTPEEMARTVHATPGRAAFIFGAERSGLETDDVALAHAIVTVPINPEFGSLNLAQAVILLAYEWSKGVALASPPATELDPPAPQADLDSMVRAFEARLEVAGYFLPPDRESATRRSLRSLLTKPAWTAREVSMMRGILRAVIAGERRE